MSGGLRLVTSDEEPVGGTAARLVDDRQAARASMSFTRSQVWWLYEVTKATITKNRFRLAELAADPVGLEVTRKIQAMKSSTEKSAATKLAAKAEASAAE